MVRFIVQLIVEKTLHNYYIFSPLFIFCLLWSFWGHDCAWSQSFPVFACSDVSLNSCLDNMHSLARIQGYLSGFKICLISSELMINHVKHGKYLHVSRCYDSHWKIKAHFRSVVHLAFPRQAWGHSGGVTMSCFKSSSLYTGNENVFVFFCNWFAWMLLKLGTRLEIMFTYDARKKPQHENLHIFDRYYALMVCFTL